MIGKFCPFCGNPLRPGAKFCPHCGEAQRVRPSLPSHSWVQRLLGLLRRLPRLRLRPSLHLMLALGLLAVFFCVLVFLPKLPRSESAPLATLQAWATQRAGEELAITPTPGDLFPPVRGDLTTEQKQAYDRLSGESHEPPSVRVAHGVSRFTTLNLEVPDSVAANVEEKAFYFLATHADLFQLADVEDNLQVTDVITDDLGGQHVWMSQSVDGIPVYGSGVGVHFSPEGQIELVNGGYLPGEFDPPTPSIIASEAEQIALHQGVYTGGEISSPATLMILSPAVFGEDGDPSLIWLLQIGSGDLDGADYLVDAQSGEIIAEIPHLHTVLDLEIRDMQRQTDWNSGVVQLNEDGPLPEVTPAPDALVVRDHIITIYDFWSDFLGRRSWDGRDGQIRIGINFNHRDCPNAFGGSIGIFYCFNLNPTLDITAHEFTHAVVDGTVDFKYRGQSGGLDESYADVFAALIEAYNPATNQFEYQSDWMIIGRNMGDPQRSSPPQPAEYSDETMQCTLQSDDYGCVHTV
jgi:Zn-dependent metalloprotease